jgi:hypothetical protein
MQCIFSVEPIFRNLVLSGIPVKLFILSRMSSRFHFSVVRCDFRVKRCSARYHSRLFLQRVHIRIYLRILVSNMVYTSEHVRVVLK